MFSLRKDTQPKYITVPQFVQMAGLTFSEYASLYRKNKIPIVRQDGQSFVNLEALVAQEENDKDAHE
jgi:hypothetical protein